MIRIECTRERYETYREHMQKLADIRAALAIMQWDQETYMPEKGADFRARQIATLSELAHERATSTELGELMESLDGAGELSEKEQKNITLNRRDFLKQKKYPAAFVRKLSETVSKSFNAWNEARKESRFSLFEKELGEVIELKKEETRLLGYSGHPYDALLDEFEKDCTTGLLDKVFGEMLPPLKTLLDKIQGAPVPDDRFLHGRFEKGRQWDFGMKIIAELGFDFNAGRQDLSTHPFSTSFSPLDVRITTRIDETDFNSMLFSCIHETGHALYEQGLPTSEYGLPSGEYTSLSIHESQSRLWENHVGRSFSFCKNHFPRLQEIFPESFRTVGVNQFYRAVNRVSPSLIRTESDEVTYHFHVMIRYEIEKMLISGDLNTRDIPGYWNESYRKWLGVEVPDDRHGCLQDVHWSHGSFGYFPTYSLGSFYAAQLFASAVNTVPGLAQKLENGNVSDLLHWLRQRVHALGRIWNSEEICQKATGETLNGRHFQEYLLDKYGKIYEF